MLLSRIKKIALETREWAEKLYNNRTPDCDWYEGLEGMCAICSAELAARLKNNGFQSKIIANDYYHAFVLCYGYIVDITATQFGHKEKVCVVHNTEFNLPEYWKIEEIFDSIKEATDYFSTWHESQQPKFVLDKLANV